MRNKRAILVGVLIAGILAYFWAGSRYPSLGEKADMGAEMELGGISFDVVVDTNLIENRWEKILYTTVNWIAGNKQGMLFGIFLAAAIMTLLSILSRKEFGNWFANTVAGVAIGTPLGVCVNCAAPIAKGLQSGGTKPETALAAMLTSPTLNIVILTMTFTLLPWYMGAIKVIFTLLLVFIAVPLVCRFVIPKRDVDATELISETELNCSPDFEKNTWKAAFRWLGKTYGKMLLQIIWKTVPLMLLAGFLGAILVTFLPWKELLKAMPGAGEYAHFVFLMLALAVVGTLLPVPIAFDIIVVVMLVAAGFKEHYAMVLLFTLGIYSVYSQLILNRMFSFATGAVLFLIICGMGIAAGGVTYYVGKWDYKRQQDQLMAGFQGLREKEYSPPILPEIPIADDIEIEKLIAENALKWEAFSKADGVEISRTPFSTKSPVGEKQFTKESGVEFGLNVPFHVDLNEFIWQFALKTRSIASGDIHNDGWPDLVIPLDNFQGGLALFSNIGGQKFLRQRVDLGSLNDKHVRCVALVDLNNDGWLDLFFATHLDGTHVVYNREGTFQTQPVKIAQRELAHVSAATFGDVDQNGLIDIVLAYWGIGWPMSDEEIPAASKNAVFLQKEVGVFDEVALSGEPGHTHTALLTDFNLDGNLDLLTGDDWYRPDVFYVGDGTGNLVQLEDAPDKIEHTPFTTMSIATADIDNDLDLEILHAAFAKGPDNRNFNRDHGLIVSELSGEALSTREAEQQEKLPKITQARTLVMARKEGSALRLYQNDMEAQEAVFRLSFYHRLRKTRQKELWPLAPDEPPFLREAIRRFEAPEMYRRTELDRRASIKESQNYSTLLIESKDGTYRDEAPQRRVNITGWTWNAKFADLDHDTWQDLYCVNGTLWNRFCDNNLFFRNQGHGTFNEQTDAFGLSDHPVTFSYTYVDFDGDGDPDIISNPNCGEVRIFKNNLQTGNSIRFQLSDTKTNRFCVGAKITIVHDGTSQIREIKCGGGYLSFDSPEVHFGLGESESVDSIKISWPDSVSSVIEGPFDSGFRYKLMRF